MNDPEGKGKPMQKNVNAASIRSDLPSVITNLSSWELPHMNHKTHNQDFPKESGLVGNAS